MNRLMHTLMGNTLFSCEAAAWLLLHLLCHGLLLTKPSCDWIATCGFFAWFAVVRIWDSWARKKQVFLRTRGTRWHFSQTLCWILCVGNVWVHSWTFLSSFEFLSISMSLLALVFIGLVTIRSRSSSKTTRIACRSGHKSSCRKFRKRSVRILLLCTLLVVWATSAHGLTFMHPSLENVYLALIEAFFKCQRMIEPLHVANPWFSSRKSRNRFLHALFGNSPTISRAKWESAAEIPGVTIHSPDELKLPGDAVLKVLRADQVCNNGTGLAFVNAVFLQPKLLVRGGQ